jgi:hypothetical protein
VLLPLVRTGAVVGVSVGDELCGRGVPPAIGGEDLKTFHAPLYIIHIESLQKYAGWCKNELLYGDKVI